MHISIYAHMELFQEILIQLKKKIIFLVIFGLLSVVLVQLNVLDGCGICGFLGMTLIVFFPMDGLKRANL